MNVHSPESLFSITEGECGTYRESQTQCQEVAHPLWKPGLLSTTARKWEPSMLGIYRSDKNCLNSQTRCLKSTAWVDSDSSRGVDSTGEKQVKLLQLPYEPSPCPQRPTNHCHLGESGLLPSLKKAGHLNFDMILSNFFLGEWDGRDYV